jgi:hypothetical protein
MRLYVMRLSEMAFMNLCESLARRDLYTAHRKRDYSKDIHTTMESRFHCIIYTYTLCKNKIPISRILHLNQYAQKIVKYVTRGHLFEFFQALY